MQKAIQLFGKYLKSATATLGNKSKAVQLVKSVLLVVTSNKTSLASIKDNLVLLSSAVTDIVSGKYIHFPKKSAIYLVAGLIYLVSPIDVIPDFIFGTGFIDDIYVINLLFKRIDKDLKAYKAWKDKQLKTVNI